MSRCSAIPYLDAFAFGHSKGGSGNVEILVQLLWGPTDCKRSYSVDVGVDVIPNIMMICIGVLLHLLVLRIPLQIYFDIAMPILLKDYIVTWKCKCNLYYTKSIATQIPCNIAQPWSAPTVHVKHLYVMLIAQSVQPVMPYSQVHGIKQYKSDVARPVTARL